MKRRRRLVGLLWRWHRRLGVSAALFAVLLAITGIALNHSTELGLDRRFVDWAWLKRAYGDGSGALPAFRLGEQWLSRVADGRIFIDTTEVASCDGKLVGALRTGEFIAAACARELLLITPGGELIEAVSASSGLPVPVTGLGLAGSAPSLQVGGRWWLADLDRLDFSGLAPGGAEIRQLTTGTLPEAIHSQIATTTHWLSWERLLLDVHSGRVAGRAGVWLIDAVGVLVATLALSGVAMWWLHRRRQNPATRSNRSP